MKNKPFLFFIAAFFLLVSCLLILILMNLFTKQPSQSRALPSPTGLQERISRYPTLYPSVGEGEAGFSPEEQQHLLKVRREADQAYQDRKNRLPFITQLPYQNNHFKVEITAISDTIYITTFGGESYKDLYRNEALAWIRQNGGNPDTLTISYKN